MDKEFKIASVESEDLSTSQNHLTFHIPEGEMYDLAKSSVHLRMKGSSTNADGNCTNSIPNLFFQCDVGAGAFSYMKSVSLIKNARLVSSVKGQLEEVRDCNLLRNTLSSLFQNEEEVCSENFNNYSALQDTEGFGSFSPLINVSRQNDVQSSFVEKVVKIPLKDIFNLGSVSQFDSRRLGKCTIHLEIAMDKLNTTEAAGYRNAHYVGDQNGQCLTDAVAGAKTSVTLGVVAAAKLYNQDYQEHIPFYNNMAVNVQAGTLDGVSIVGQKRTITAINYDTTTKQVSLTLNATLGTVAAAGIVGLVLEPLVTGYTSSIAVNQAELRLHALGSNNMPSSPPEMIQYTQFKLEKDTGAGVANFKKQYVVEPDAVNLLVCPKLHSNGLLSNMTITGVRVAVDNEETRDRDINPYTPLYFSSLEALALNRGMNIKSVMGKDFKSQGGINRGNNVVLNVVAEPLPVKNNMKLVELEMVTAVGGGFSDINVYKEVVSSA